MRSDIGQAAYLPLWVIAHRTLSHGAIRVYALILAAWTDRDGYATPTRDHLAAEVHSSVGSVDRWIRELVDVGALVAQGKSGHANRYAVRFCNPLLRTGEDSIEDSAHTPDHGNLYAEQALALKEGPPGGQQKVRIREEITNRDFKKHTGTVQDTQNQAISIPNTVRKPVGLQRRAHTSTVRNTTRFQQFYTRYPRHVCRVKAHQAWLKTNAESDTLLFTKLMAGLHRWIKLWDALRTEPRYIPHPATWLNQRQWEDECNLPVPRPTLTTQTQGMIAATAHFLGTAHE